MSNGDNSNLQIVQKYYFKCEESSLPDELRSVLKELESAFSKVKIDKFKKSSEKSRTRLFSPVCLNQNIKKVLSEYEMLPENGRKIICDYSNINERLSQDIDKIRQIYDCFTRKRSFNKKEFQEAYETLEQTLSSSDLELNSFTTSWKKLTKGFGDHGDKYKTAIVEKLTHKEYKMNSLIDETDFVAYLTKDFVGFREIDFIKNDVGIEIQFGKYAFMVYNVCAKMKIFEKAGKIKYGIEVVPTKKMQKRMSTGVSFFEQFVWDLNERGAFNEDVPVVILGVEPNKEGFLALDELNEDHECSIARTNYE